MVLAKYTGMEETRTGYGNKWHGKGVDLYADFIVIYCIDRVSGYPSLP
jgi:hypothetical protein